MELGAAGIVIGYNIVSLEPLEQRLTTTFLAWSHRNIH